MYFNTDVNATTSAWALSASSSSLTLRCAVTFLSSCLSRTSAWALKVSPGVAILLAAIRAPRALARVLACLLGRGAKSRQIMRDGVLRVVQVSAMLARVERDSCALLAHAWRPQSSRSRRAPTTKATKRVYKEHIYLT